MKLLLDTHTFIWFSEDNPNISDKARAVIEAPNNELYLSIGMFWEMAIKISLGKLELTSSLSQIMLQVQVSGFALLPIDAEDLLEVEKMPFIHRDPFDRLLIAQALTKGLTLVSNEGLFDEYGVSRVW